MHCTSNIVWVWFKTANCLLFNVVLYVNEKLSETKISLNLWSHIIDRPTAQSISCSPPPYSLTLHLFICLFVCFGSPTSVTICWNLIWIYIHVIQFKNHANNHSVVFLCIYYCICLSFADIWTYLYEHVHVLLQKENLMTKFYLMWKLELIWL